MSEAVAVVTADKVIDARGTACPGPLLEAKKAMGQVKVGQVIEVKSNDKGSRKDIAAWSAKMGHEFLGVVEEPSFMKLYVKKMK